MTEHQRPDVAVVIPTYEHFDYAAAALATAAVALGSRGAFWIVDDASPSVQDGRMPPPLAEICQRLFSVPVFWHRFPAWGGLTRSWNYGLGEAIRQGCRWVCVTNSDVLFPLGWWEPLQEALESGFCLAGPATNAPGPCLAQHVVRWVPDYRPDDDPRSIQQIQDRLRGLESQEVDGLNGFCLAASAEAWRRGAFDESQGWYFRPRNDRDVRGRPNPTPLMTGNEDELIVRWRQQGCRFAVCPGSFVFHYRSVSRGPRYFWGQAYRKG